MNKIKNRRQETEQRIKKGKNYSDFPLSAYDGWRDLAKGGLTPDYLLPLDS